MTRTANTAHNLNTRKRETYLIPTFFGSLALKDIAICPFGEWLQSLLTVQSNKICQCGWFVRTIMRMHGLHEALGAGSTFPGSGNNSLWACLCSDFTLRALRSCWEDFDVLSKWIDCASRYSPSSQTTRPTDSVTCDEHHQILDRMLGNAPISFLPPPLQLCKCLKYI